MVLASFLTKGKHKDGSKRSIDIEVVVNIESKCFDLVACVKNHGTTNRDALDWEPAVITDTPLSID